MAHLRTWAEWEELAGSEVLSEAELLLVERCKAGEVCILGDGTRPDAPSPSRSIRADLLRYLILGGCDACRTDETGVRLVGAYVTGPLDLSFGEARGQTSLKKSAFESRIVARRAGLELLDLTGTTMPGLFAPEFEVRGEVCLDGIEVEGEVNFLGAKIGGQLDCTKAQFRHPNGMALNAYSASVMGGIFLLEVKSEGEISLAGTQICGQLACENARCRNAGKTALNVQGATIMDGIFLRDAEVEGEISLAGTKIGGQLSCETAQFRNDKGKALNAQGAAVARDVFLREVRATGEISLVGAQIGGQLDCEKLRLRNFNGKALNAQHLHVAQGLLWRGIEVGAGSLYFASAHVSDLADDCESWPDSRRVYLDGFTYDRILGSFLDVPNRLEWLRRGSRWDAEFFPQPYTQLAKVLREMGHDSAARKVLMVRERLIRQQARKDARVIPNGVIDVALQSIAADLGNGWRWAKDITLRFLTGYGYAPGRSLVALVILFLAATFLADRAWTEGSFAPNSGPVLVSEDWKAYDARDCLSLGAAPGCLPNPAAAWSAAGAPGADWDSFNPLGYAADLVIPILDLGQTAAWAPSKDRGAWGWGLWWGRWLLSALGWIVTALGAAAITGIIRQDRG